MIYLHNVGMYEQYLHYIITSKLCKKNIFNKIAKNINNIDFIKNTGITFLLIF